MRKKQHQVKKTGKWAASRTSLWKTTRAQRFGKKRKRNQRQETRCERKPTDERTRGAFLFGKSSSRLIMHAWEQLAENHARASEREREWAHVLATRSKFTSTARQFWCISFWNANLRYILLGKKMTMFYCLILGTFAPSDCPGKPREHIYSHI